MAAALVSEEFSARLEDTKMCDAFTLGGTKNGLMFGEALVIVNDELKKAFKSKKTKRSHVGQKGFIAGSMYKTMFAMEDGYLKGARHAQKASKSLGRWPRKKRAKNFFMPFY